MVNSRPMLFTLQFSMTAHEKLLPRPLLLPQMHSFLFASPTSFSQFLPMPSSTAFIFAVISTIPFIFLALSIVSAFLILTK